MPYLVATDLDGTLLRGDFTVSERTRRALRDATAAGIEVVYATGRPPRWLPEVYEATDFQPITICANGALTLQGDEVLDVVAIPGPVVEQLYELLSAHEVEFIFHAEEWNGHVLKVLAAAPDLGDKDADSLLEQVSALVGHLVEPTHSATGRLLIEMGPGGITKANAVEKVREQFFPGYTRIAVGDMPNDMELLRWADIPVTVETGHPWLKTLTERVMPGPDEDGLAMLLEDLVGGMFP
jgi:HAD superfamily hydrolase (TIGR01484 family)